MNVDHGGFSRAGNELVQSEILLGDSVGWDGGVLEESVRVF